MRHALVITIAGGVLQDVHSSHPDDIDVVLIDIDNINAGDPIPELPIGVSVERDSRGAVSDVTCSSRYRQIF